MRLTLAFNPYLFGCVVLFAFWLLVLLALVRRRRRRDIREFWWGSLACSLLAFTEPLFVPEYWNPPSVLAYRNWDLESFFFCFAVGGISAVAPEWRRLRDLFQSVDYYVWRASRTVVSWFERLTSGSPSPVFSEVRLTRDELRQENAILAAIFIGTFAFTAHLNLNVIYDSSLTCVAVGAYIGWRAPRLRWQVFGGAVTFLAVYAAVLRVVTWQYPAFYREHWNLPALSGIWLFGAPAEEYLFAATLGALWAPLYEAWKNERDAKWPLHDETTGGLRAEAAGTVQAGA